MVSRGTHSVPLTEDIPVALAYHTRFLDERGQAASFPDIYGDRVATK